MTITTLHKIPRDGYGRPMVIPPNGGKPVAYTRATTFVNCLDDTFNLSRWQMRMVALGLAESPDLMLQISSTAKDNKDALNKICESAMERAKAHAAATIGTALHALTERLDKGEDVGIIPEAYQADLHAYEAATVDLDAVHIEQFSVNDEYKVGGTPDRVVWHDGRLKIADIKTGSIDWGMGKIAMQLAMYAHSMPYDHTTGARSYWSEISGRFVDLDEAIVIHLPAGTGTCSLIPVDIAKGWEGVELASQVRGWRSLKWPTLPYAETPPPSFVREGHLLARIENDIAVAKTEKELEDLWRDYEHVWTEDLTALAAARKALLTGEAVR